jgi:hypothetical protein
MPQRDWLAPKPLTSIGDYFRRRIGHSRCDGCSAAKHHGLVPEELAPKCLLSIGKGTCPAKKRMLRSTPKRADLAVSRATLAHSMLRLGSSPMDSVPGMFQEAFSLRASRTLMEQGRAARTWADLMARQRQDRLGERRVLEAPPDRVARRLAAGDRWFRAWASEVTASFPTLTMRSGIPFARLMELDAGSPPSRAEIEVLAKAWWITPAGLIASMPDPTRVVG